MLSCQRVTNWAFLMGGYQWFQVVMAETSSNSDDPALPLSVNHHFRAHSHLVLFEFTVLSGFPTKIYQFWLIHHVAGPQCEFWTLRICLWLRHDGCLRHVGSDHLFFNRIFPVVNSPKMVQWYPKKARDAANFHSIPQGWDVLLSSHMVSAIFSQKKWLVHIPMAQWSNDATTKPGQKFFLLTSYSNPLPLDSWQVAYGWHGGSRISWFALKEF